MTPESVDRLFATVAPRYGDTQRRLPPHHRALGARKGDAAEMAYIELLGAEHELNEKAQKRAEARTKKREELAKQMEEQGAGQARRPQRRSLKTSASIIKRGAPQTCASFIPSQTAISLRPTVGPKRLIPARPVYTPRSGRSTRSGPVRQDTYPLCTITRFLPARFAAYKASSASCHQLKPILQRLVHRRHSRR